MSKLNTKQLDWVRKMRCNLATLHTGWYGWDGNQKVYGGMSKANQWAKPGEQTLNIGDKVVKRSGKPFKSGRKVNTVKGSRPIRRQASLQSRLRKMTRTWSLADADRPLKPN